MFFDANKDGWPDLFVSNYYPRPDGLPTPNRFYLNDHGKGFVSAPGYGLNRTVGGLALAPGCQQSGDYSGDGFRDLLVCGRAGIHLYRNNGGTSFTDVTGAVGLSGVWYGARDGGHESRRPARPGHGQPAAAAGADPAAHGRFGVVSIAKRLVGGRAVATGDVNGDGYPDVYVLRAPPGRTRSRTRRTSCT